MADDLVSRIDDLLAEGERYATRFPLCQHCSHDWHGLVCAATDCGCPPTDGPHPLRSQRLSITPSGVDYLRRRGLIGVSPAEALGFDAGTPRLV